MKIRASPIGIPEMSDIFYDLSFHFIKLFYFFILFIYFITSLKMYTFKTSSLPSLG